MHTKEWLNISHDPRCCVVKEKFQFQYTMDRSRHPWAFKRDHPQKRIAALELYGTLFLALLPMAQQPSTACRLHIPLVSDNQGNVYSILNNADPQGFDPTLKVSLTIFPKNSLDPSNSGIRRYCHVIGYRYPPVTSGGKVGVLGSMERLEGSPLHTHTHTERMFSCGLGCEPWHKCSGTTTLAHRYWQ